MRNEEAVAVKLELGDAASFVSLQLTIAHFPGLGVVAPTAAAH